MFPTIKVRPGRVYGIPRPNLTVFSAFDRVLRSADGDAFSGSTSPFRIELHRGTSTYMGRRRTCVGVPPLLWYWRDSK
jgi:hypothetical protein